MIATRTASEILRQLFYLSKVATQIREKNKHGILEIVLHSFVKRITYYLVYCCVYFVVVYYN